MSNSRRRQNFIPFPDKASEREGERETTDTLRREKNDRFMSEIISIEKTKNAPERFIQ